MMNKHVFVQISLIAMLLLAAYTTASVVRAKSQPYLENTQQAATATENIPVNVITELPVTTEIPTVTPSPTPAQLPTQLATETPTQTLTPAAVPVPCNLAGFVGDVTIPDGSLANPGDTFVKTWRLQNLGACSWTPGYELVFYRGDLMSGPTAVQLPGNVNPGDTVDLSVTLVAPSSSGTYQGYWMLRDPSGDLFGIGPDGSQPFWVQISIPNSEAFEVTRVDGSMNPTSYTGVCPSSITFNANIWTNGAGTVTYYWIRSDGSTSPESTLTYDSSGYQTVSDAWTIGNPASNYSGWDQIYIDQPNQEYFNPFSFNLACSPAVPTATINPTQTPTPTPTLIPTVTLIPTLPAPTQPPTLTPTPTEPAPALTPTPTQTLMPTQQAPTQTPTPTPTPTQPTPTQPAPTLTHTPTQILTPTQQTPTPKYKKPTPSEIPTPTASPTPTQTEPGRQHHRDTDP
jgi:hypothetical protein